MIVFSADATVFLEIGKLNFYPWKHKKTALKSSRLLLNLGPVSILPTSPKPAKVSNFVQ
jgi:hypothetical protein